MADAAGVIDAPLERYRDLIERALEQAGQGYTFEDVRRDVEEGHAILWPGENSVAITYVRPMKAMHVWVAGGELEELKQMAVACEDFAKTIGCDAIMAGGRSGWSRALRQLGWNAYALKEFG